MRRTGGGPSIGTVPLGVALALTLCACDMIDVYEGRIRRASRAIEAATTDADRASAYADRGRGVTLRRGLLLVRSTARQARRLDSRHYVLGVLPRVLRPARNRGRHSCVEGCRPSTRGRSGDCSRGG